MKSKTTMILLSCAAMAAITPSLSAATSLLDTTSAGVSQNGGVIAGGLAFSTGSQAYRLDSIEFAPRAYSAGNLTLRLYAADASTHLPTSTSALASETFSNVFADVYPVVPMQVTFTNNFTLEANSSYVLEFSAPEVMMAGLNDANSNSYPANVSVGTSGMTYHGYTFNFDSWSAPEAAYAPYLKLTGTATASVPEPSAFALLGLGTMGLIARRRRAVVA